MLSESASVGRNEQVLSDLSRIKKPDFSMLSVALQEIRNLL